MLTKYRMQDYNKVRLLNGNTDLKTTIFIYVIFVLVRFYFKRQLNRLIQPKYIFEIGLEYY